VTQSDLQHLVKQARRDRPGPGVLPAVARNLGVPFVAAPLAAIIVPSSATAAVWAKVGLSRATLVAWGASSAAAVSGVAAAVLLAQPAPLPSPAAPQPPLERSSAPQPEAAELAPPPLPERSVPPEERKVQTGAREALATWDEPRLIERARRALSSEPRRALSLAQEHQRRFPSGALALEREVIVVEALARSGQNAEARRRALAFEAKYPKSIHSPRIRALRERLGR
jgi:hypothetical protein